MKFDEVLYCESAGKGFCPKADIREHFFDEYAFEDLNNRVVENVNGISSDTSLV